MSLKFTISSILVLFLALALAISLMKEDRLAPVNSQTYFPISIDGHELQLQLALSPSEQKKGLMYRESLAKDHGMLFLFDKPDQASFWMRNTRIPLDIAYFDESGLLKEVHPLYPFDETSVMSSGREILIAIETNQEWFAQKSIRAGALIDMAALNAALRRRNHINLAIVP